jgi:hypothetical protein
VSNCFGIKLNVCFVLIFRELRKLSSFPLQDDDKDERASKIRRVEPGEAAKKKK